MTISEYRKILETTQVYDNREAVVYTWLKEIIDVSVQMNYQKTLNSVKEILNQYGTVKSTKINDQPVSYIIINAPLKVKEQIANLKYHVHSKQECDLSEKILCVK